MVDYRLNPEHAHPAPWKMRSEGTFTEAPEVEKVREMLAFAEHLETETYLYSYHYLNPVHFAVNMPQEKEKICTGLCNFLRENTAEEIEEMVGRRFKVSL